VDGLGRRVVKEINGVASQQFLYQSQLQLAAVLDPTGHIVSEFVYGTKANVPDYMVQGGVTYRIISDNLGSPKVVVNSATGAVVETISYDEFGNVLSDSNPGFIPFGFAGGIYDRDTGLLRFGARDYDPSIGRWLAKDPLLFGGGDTNLYGYVANDPVNWTDPSGKCPLCVAAGIGAAVGAAANLTGSYIAGTLTFTNAGQTALVGALAGGAAVLTSGTAALATATSLTGLVTTELGSGLVGTLAGAGIDLGLTALTSPPNPYPQTLRPQNTCP
jgi:RHS repeat-associated protein